MSLSVRGVTIFLRIYLLVTFAFPHFFLYLIMILCLIYHRYSISHWNILPATHPTSTFNENLLRDKISSAFGAFGICSHPYSLFIYLCLCKYILFCLISVNLLYKSTRFIKKYLIITLMVVTAIAKTIMGVYVCMYIYIISPVGCLYVCLCVM